jgi:hypothetical protein
MLLYTRRLGHRGALISAGLLALSPSFTLFSRTSSGVILGVATTLVMLGALLAYHDRGTQDQRWLAVVGLALGLGIISGGTFLGLTLPLVLACWAARLPEASALWRAMTMRRPLLAAAAAAVLGSTLFFFFPQGFGVVADGLISWISNFGLDLSGRTPGILALYEPFILLFGLAGATLALLRGDGLAKALAYWAVVGLIVALARPDQPDAPFLVLVPLVLLAANVEEILPRKDRDEEIQTKLLWAGAAAAITILGVHIFISLGQYANHSVSNPQRASASLILAGISAILVVGIVLLTWTYHWRSALRGLALALLVLLSLYSWGRTWELGHTHQSDPRELWVDEATAPGARILVQTLKTASERVNGSPYTLPLTVQSDEPLLYWYLRDFAHVVWVDALQPTVISEAVVAPEEEQNPLLGDNYMGMDLELRLSSPPAAEPHISQWLRWILLRHLGAAGDPAVTSRVVVWLRQDITLADFE